MRAITGVVGGAVVGGLVYSLTEPFRYVIKRYEITHPNIPKSFNKYQIVFLADIHYGRTSKERFLSKVVRRVNALKPDLILLGGDYITHRRYIRPCFDILKLLQARDGVYGVLGNHDVSESEPETLYHMRRSGIKCLTNESIWIGDKEKIKLGGVGDLWTQTQEIEHLTNDLLKNDYTILLTHNPKYIYQIDEIDKISLALAGHTHGAQCSPLKYLEKISPDSINHRVGLEYLSGKYTRGDTDIIVSNGIGTAKIPFRFMAPPEILVITLRSGH